MDKIIKFVKWNISVIEDCAESLGSYVDDVHTGGGVCQY